MNIKNTTYQIVKASRLSNSFLRILLLVFVMHIISVEFGFASSLQSKSYVDATVKNSDWLISNIDRDAAMNTYHLFSHGRPAELQINGKWINAVGIATFVKNQNLPSSISILNLYGCNFAKGAKGIQAIDYLEKELGLKVNASTNVTGKDGDWFLEVGNSNCSKLSEYQYNLQFCPDEDGTAANPFKNLGKARNITTAGIYYFNIGGNAFSTYVDANGYVQVAIDFGNGSGNLPQSTNLTNTARGILTPAVLASLTATNEIRISHSGGILDATSLDFILITKLLNDSTLHTGINDTAANSSWTGTGASVLTTTGTNGTTTAGFLLEENVFHTRGDGSGLHWIPSSSNQRISYTSGEILASESLHLWVRAGATIDSDCDGYDDNIDLDDDNDGILDDDEITCESVTEYEFFGTFGTLNGNTNSVLRALNTPAPVGYTFGGNGSSPLNPAGTYAVTNGATSFNLHSASLWDGLSGHTTGLDNDAYVAINGNTTQATFYEDQVILTAGLTYEFGAWVAYSRNLTSTNSAVSEITVRLVRVSDNQVVASFDSGPIHLRKWRKTSAVFIPATTELYKYELKNKSIQTSGNDFALDDVFLVDVRCLNSDFDLDGDGIPNRLDLDSDADGCPDVIEGSGGFNSTSLVTDTNMAGGSTNVQQNLGRASNNDGTPNIEGTSTTDTEKQGAGKAHVYSAETKCCADAGNYTTIVDSDGDNIGDDCDLDDDNDGILDTDECADLGEYNFNNWANPSGGWQVNTNGSIASNTVNSAMSTISFYQDGLTGLTMLTFHVELRGQNKNNSSTSADVATLDFRVNGIPYVEWENTSATSPTFPIPGNLNTLNGASIVPSTFEITASTFEPYTITIPWNPAIDTANLDFKITTGLDDFILKNFNFSESLKSYLCTDSDGDGIGNNLDLDSDGDGCPDALEGGANISEDSLMTSMLAGGNTDSSGFIGTAGPVFENLGNNVNSLGIPTIADMGQSVGSSQIAGEDTITEQAQNQIFCEGSIPGTVSFTFTDSSTISSDSIYYQWQVSTDDGANFNDLSGESGVVANNMQISLDLTGISIADDGNLYRVEYFTSSKTCKSISTPATLNIYPQPKTTVNDRGLCMSSNPQQILASPSGGVFSGGSYITSSGIFDPSTSGIGNFPVYYMYSTSGCVWQSDTAEITVSENPSVSLATNPICVDAAAEQLVVSPVGGMFSGNGVSSTGLFTPSVAGVGIHKVSYTVTNTSTGCAGTAYENLVVNKLPKIKIKSYGPFCPDDESVQIESNPTGGTYSGTGVSSTGLFSPSTAGVGLHTISYKVTQNGCTDSTNIEIEVLDGSNLMVSPMRDTICSGDTSLFVVTGNNGHTVNWSTDVFGKSGTGTSIEESFVNNGNTPYTVNFSIESTTGNCVNKIESNLLVNPNPTVHSIPQSAVICDYEDLSVKLNATRPGTTITWELKDNMGIVLDNGTGIDNVNITNSSLSSGTYTLEYTGTLNGCTSEQYQLPITIN